MDKYQIFISYRRDGGDALAGRLTDRFSYMGYKVFYDVESMRSGTFNTQILDAISQCSDFLLVLPPNALDRCTNKGDWVRKELAFALKNKKNVIPIMMRGFSFPRTLPFDIRNVRNIEGVVASSEYFDAVIDKIQHLLISKPIIDVRKHSNVNNENSVTIIPQTSKEQFSSILRRLFKVTTSYKQAFRNANQELVLLTTNELQELVQVVYDIQIETKYSDPELSRVATDITNKYNEYAVWYNKFVDSPDRMSDEIQKYAAMADKLFAEFVDLITRNF